MAVTTSVTQLCRSCGMPILGGTLWVRVQPYHPECINVTDDGSTAEIARPTAENEALRARLETVEAETRERCAERAESFSLAEHIAFDMREGIFPEQSDRQTAIADAIRNLEPRHD